MRKQIGANLRRRLDALEERTLHEPTILTMPDGSTARISGGGNHLFRLFWCRLESPSPKQAGHLELIRRSTDSKEPGGGRMVELIRCMLQGPSVRPTAGENRT
jgi:hypothetical protein